MSRIRGILIAIKDPWALAAIDKAIQLARDLGHRRRDSRNALPG